MLMEKLTAIYRPWFALFTPALIMGLLLLIPSSLLAQSSKEGKAKKYTLGETDNLISQKESMEENYWNLKEKREKNQRRPDSTEIKEAANEDSEITKKRTVKQINGSNAMPAQRVKAQMSKAAQSKNRPRFYVLKAEDTLENVAERFYGTPAVWTTIYDKNEGLINNPEIVDLTGQKIELPLVP